jgi:hypothetical protein
MQQGLQCQGVGIGWVPARPRAGADSSKLRALAVVQARLVQEWLGIRSDGTAPDDLRDRRHATADATLADVSDQLLAGLDIPVGADGSWPCFRVAVIADNPLFPPDWRVGAYATLLPAEAAEVVARWRWWYRQVTAGRMRHYLQRLSAWDTGRRLHDAQAALTALAEQTRSRSNAWTRTERFRHARDQVLQLPTPPAVAPARPTAGHARRRRTHARPGRTGCGAVRPHRPGRRRHPRVSTDPYPLRSKAAIPSGCAALTSRSATSGANSSSTGSIPLSGQDTACIYGPDRYSQAKTCIDEE